MHKKIELLVLIIDIYVNTWVVCLVCHRRSLCYERFLLSNIAKSLNGFFLEVQRCRLHIFSLTQSSNENFPLYAKFNFLVAFYCPCWQTPTFKTCTELAIDYYLYRKWFNYLVMNLIYQKFNHYMTFNNNGHNCNFLYYDFLLHVRS